MIADLYGFGEFSSCSQGGISRWISLPALTESHASSTFPALANSASARDNTSSFTALLAACPVKHSVCTGLESSSRLMLPFAARATDGAAASAAGEAAGSRRLSAALPLAEAPAGVAEDDSEDFVTDSYESDGCILAGAAMLLRSVAAPARLLA